MVQNNNGSLFMVTGPDGSVSVSLSDLVAQSGLDNPSMEELTGYWASQNAQISPQTTLPGNISMTTYYTDSGPRRTFWENTDAGPVPLSRSNNSTLRQLELFLKAGRYDNPLENPTDAVIAEAINTFSGQNEYGLSSPSQPQGGFVQGKDLPTGVPPGMEDQWFMRSPEGGLSAWSPPEQSTLSIDQQIAQMVSQGKFESARQLNEMKRAFNEKRMTQEEIADRASRLAQTPQEMQAWMSAMTGGPTAGDGRSWGSAYPTASMSQVIEQFKQIIGTQPTPETTPDEEQPSIADSVGAVPGDGEDIVDADTTVESTEEKMPISLEQLRAGINSGESILPFGTVGRDMEESDIDIVPTQRVVERLLRGGGTDLVFENINQPGTPWYRTLGMGGPGRPQTAAEREALRGGIARRGERTRDRLAKLQEGQGPSRTYIRREPGRRPTIGVRPDPIVPGDISFAEASRMSEEERVLREQDEAMKTLAALGPMDIEEYGLGAGNEAELDIIRRREAILGRPNALYKTPGATGTVKLSRFGSTPEERAFIERTGGINPANMTVSASGRVDYQGVGGELSPLRYREPRPELFYGSEEEELLQEEPRMAALQPRSIRDIERSIARSRPAQSPSETPLVTPSEEELHLLEEDRAASLGRQEASRMFDPRDVTLEDAQRTAQARMRMLGYRPTDLEIAPTDIVDEDVAVPETRFGISRPVAPEVFDERYYESPEDEILPLQPMSAFEQRIYGSAKGPVARFGEMVNTDDRKTNKKAIGSFQYGGVVDETGAYNLHKGELVVNPFERFPSLNPYKPMDQASFQQMRQSAGQGVTQGFAPEQGEQGLLSAGSEAILESREAARIARGKQRELDRPAREERRRQREAERESRKLRNPQGMAAMYGKGVAGGGSFFQGSQVIPYADTAARLTALQKTGLSRRDAAMFDQAERERSMAGQQRFVRRGGKRRAYG